MTYLWNFYPMFALFAFTWFIGYVMFRKRAQSVVRGDVHIKYFRTYSEGEGTKEILQMGRHFSNLFEAPVFFYIISVLAIVLRYESVVFHVCAWGFVVSRVLHAHIHIGRNDVIHRLRAFVFSNAILVTMWGLMLFHVARL